MARLLQARILLAAAAAAAAAGLVAEAFVVAPSAQRGQIRAGRGRVLMAAGGEPVNPDHDLLLRVARGEKAHRTPVWLMRQVRWRWRLYATRRRRTGDA